MDPVTLLMALIYFLAGITCIQRPARLVEWMGKTLKRGTTGAEPQWLHGRGVIFFIRLIGFFALLNAVMLFYATFYSR